MTDWISEKREYTPVFALYIECMVLNIVLAALFYSLLFFSYYDELKHITLGKDIYLLY